MGAQRCGIAPVLVGGGEAQGARRRGDEREGAQPLRVLRRVERREFPGGGVAEQVGLFEAEVHAERLDVVDEAVDRVGRGVLGDS